MAARKKIAIVGANFAGLTTALRLSKRHSVTVFDPAQDFEFLPNIHELVSGVKSPETLRLSRRRLLQRAGHRFVRSAVESLDPRAGTLTTASGRRLGFDVCVLAAGGVNNTFGVQGVEKFAMPFKSVADCAAIGKRLRSLTGSGGQISIVIVGGGLEGVEALGEILRRYRNVAGLAVHLVESGARLVPSAPAALGRHVEKSCEPYPVTFHKNVRVTRVTATGVRVSSGKMLRSDITIWTGGAAPHPLLAVSGLSPEPGMWAPVRPTLQSKFFDNVFVIGDAAKLPKSISKQAYHALEMGAFTAANIERLLRGAPLEHFRPGPEMGLISLGDIDTYLVIAGVVVASPALAAVKEAVYQLNMARFDPPRDRAALSGIRDRSCNSIIELGLPAVRSLSALVRLAGLRVLS